MSTVLYIEDNTDTSWSAGYLLKEAGWDFQTAATLAEVVATYEAGSAKPPDVVLLDLNLLDSKGVDTLDDVSAMFPGVPIVVITGQSNIEEIAKKSGSGEPVSKRAAFAVLRKPITDAADMDVVLKAAVDSAHVNTSVAALKRELKKELSRVDEVADNLTGPAQ